jgi:hypothetical protein
MTRLDTLVQSLNDFSYSSSTFHEGDQAMKETISMEATLRVSTNPMDATQNVNDVSINPMDITQPDFIFYPTTTKLVDEPIFEYVIIPIPSTPSINLINPIADFDKEEILEDITLEFVTDHVPKISNVVGCIDEEVLIYSTMVTDYFISFIVPMRDITIDSTEKVVSATNPTTIEKVVMPNHVKEVVVEGAIEVVIKTDVEITTKLFNEIMEIDMDPNNNTITQISTKLIDELIDPSTNLVDMIVVKPTITIEEALETLGVSKPCARYLPKGHAIEPMIEFMDETCIFL